MLNGKGKGRRRGRLVLGEAVLEIGIRNSSKSEGANSKIHLKGKRKKKHT